MNDEHSISRYFAIDRFEASKAVLVDDDGAERAIDRSALPPNSKEGDVIRVPIDPRGYPQWRDAQLDAAERERRLARARTAIERLRQRDPGDDIEL